MKILYCILGVVISVFTAKAELSNKMFDIKHLGYTEGLSSQRVFSIIEDQHHAIWIATKTGIDRYNGNFVKNYVLPGNFHYGDMAGRRLRLIYDDTLGILAFDNTGRIFSYSAEHDDFGLILALSEYMQGEIILNVVKVDPKGNFYLGLSRGLYRKAPDGAFEELIPGQYINDIAIIDNTIYAAGSNGLMEYLPDGTFSFRVKDKDIQTLYYNKDDDEFWIGTFNEGLWIWDLHKTALYPIKGQDANFSNPIRAICRYDNETFLLGVDGGGVYSIGKDSKEARLLMSTDDSTDIYLRGNGIYALKTDVQGNIWIGSYSGGVSVAILPDYQTQILKHEKGNSQSIANNNINAIAENSDGRLWFATDDGISIYNSKQNEWTHRLKGSVVVTFCNGENGSIWAGTYGNGVFLLNADGKEIRHLSQEANILTTNYVFSITRDKDGDIWVGGHNGPLVLVDKNGRRKKTYDIKWVHSIETLANGTVSVATVNGFYIIDKVNDTLKNYASFTEFYHKNASAYIVSMLFNDDGTVWLGTEGGGLNLYNINNGEIQTLSTIDGLPSDDVYSIQKDGRGRLWLSTGKGLALIENKQVLNLNYLGDIDKEYNKSSFAKLSDGRFAYGSTDGVVLVMPDAIAKTDYKADLRITGLSIDYLETDKAKEMQGQIYNMLNKGMVALAYRHNSFTVSFESINHRFQRDISFQHILEGYEKTWSYSSVDGKVRYTKVTPGTYTLRVRNIRSSDGELISEKSLILTVAEPWWNTWGARLSYFILVALFLYFIIRFNSNRLQKKYDEDKIRFFVNTAHDIRTPVTLIMGPLEDLRNSSDLSESARYFVDLAHNNTQKLDSLITRLLDFEKIDRYKQKLNLTNINLNKVLAEELIDFQSYCDKKQVQLKLELPAEDIFIRADKHMLELVLDNLISNACKYTLSGGEVSLVLTANRQKANITVKDTGIGIPKKDRKYLFKEVFRAENAQSSQEKGSGFGLLQVHRIVKSMQGKLSYQSEENKGTSFTITLARSFETRDTSPRSLTDPLEPKISVPISAPLRTRTLAEDNELNKDCILIVEDNDALRYYLKHTFSPDYKVVDVANGEEAIVFLGKDYPDLILSDLMMPGIQGDELCRIVKDNPETAGIPFVLLTAKTTHEAAVKGFKEGADDYIPKPFSTEILKLKVHNIIESRKRQREYFLRQSLQQVGLSQDSQVEDDSEPGQKFSENDRLFIELATGIVVRNISDSEFGVDELCQEMAMSRTLFFSRLKSLTGKAPQEFIRLIRLQNAAELLKNGYSVSDASMQSGFANSKYFSSLFKKTFGVQPSKFQHPD